MTYKAGRWAWAVACFAMTLTGWAQRGEIAISIETDKKPYTSLDVNDDPENFQFIVVTDRTGGNRPGVFEDGIRKVNLLQPEFVMSVGDLIQGYTEDLAELNRQWDEFDDFVTQLEMPFFYIPGNHDITNHVMEDLWKERYGPTYYHFVYRNVLFLCLNSEDPPASQISKQQVAYVEKALAENRDVRWTLVFIHKPLWIYNNPDNNWHRVEALLQGRPHTVYAGHTHNYFKHIRNDEQYIVLATMGGGSRLRGPNFGEFDHFMWVTMTDEGPRMANLMLSGIWDTNIMTDERLALVRPLISGAAVRTEGIVADTAQFTEAHTKLRLTNDGVIPLQVSLSITQEEGISTSVKQYQATIPPDSVELMDLTIRAQHPTPVEDLPPLRVHWTATYEPPGHVQPVRARGTHRIIIDQEFELTPVSGIRVDGDLADWRVLPLWGGEPGQVREDQGGNWTGPQDATARFAAGFDDDYLYLAIDALDDELRISPTDRFDRQDSIEVLVDPAPESSNRDSILRIVLLPGIAPEDAHERAALPPLPEGVRLGSAQTETGHQSEIAIPLSHLVNAQGQDWNTVRINVGIHDRDADGQVSVWWRPEWSSPANYARSGMFRRQ